MKEQKGIKVLDRYYAAIRKNDNGKWIDSSSLSCDAETCRDKALQGNREAGRPWSEANPIVSIQDITINIV